VSTICPYLYRDEKGMFVCSVTGKTIDPLTLPCLTKYVECILYRRAKERAEAPEAEVEVKPEIEERAEVEVPPTPPAVEEGELILQSMNDVARELEKLDRLWSEYEDSTKNFLNRWERIKANAEAQIEVLKELISVIRSEIEELDVKVELRLMDKNYYRKRREDLERKLREYEDRLNRLNSIFESNIKRAEEHLKKIMSAKPIAESRLRLTLMKLEDLRREGKLPEETYLKLKEELTGSIEERIEEGEE